MEWIASLFRARSVPLVRSRKSVENQVEPRSGPGTLARMIILSQKRELRLPFQGLAFGRGESSLGSSTYLQCRVVNREGKDCMQANPRAMHWCQREGRVMEHGNAPFPLPDRVQNPAVSPLLHKHQFSGFHKLISDHPVHVHSA